MENTQINEDCNAPDEQAIEDETTIEIIETERDSEEICNIEENIIKDNLQENVKHKKKFICLTIAFICFIIGIVFLLPVWKSALEVNDVIKRINSIGTIEYTKESKELIDTAFLKYNALDEEQRKKIKNYDVLIKKSEEYISLEKINSVINKINSIGNVEYTKEFKELIDSISSEYNSLSEKQKAEITNYNILTQKITQYNDLKYYDNLIKACRFVDRKAETAMGILSELITTWYNVNNKKRDSYNNGKYDFDTAINNYWESLEYLENRLLLFDFAIDNAHDEKITLNDYLSELKNPPAQYLKHHEEFSNLYAKFKAMTPLTQSINHTYNSFSDEIRSLTSDYRLQYSKMKTMIPELSNIF